MASSVFSLLHKDIQEMLKSKKIFKPTLPQEKAIPHILTGKNILLIAPTGHGKTESALLPVFHEFLKEKTQLVNIKGISIIYITPLRALNRDMLKRTIEWGKTLDIRIAVRHGDTPNSERVKQSKNPPDMLITTPETFQILFIGKNLKKHLEKVKWVIVDEIHELAHDERGAQLSIGLERLEEVTIKQSHSFQRIGLSATVGSAHEVSKYLGGIYNENQFRSVKIIEVDAIKNIDLKVELPKTIKQDYEEAVKLTIDPKSFSAMRRCKELIDKHVSTLFFINTRDGAEIITSRFHMWKPDFNIGVHHGSLSKIARVEAEDQFKDGILKSLICTSSLELGIDVGNTDFVIQYNSPREVTRIVQRIGRSGHSISKTSKGVIIATNAEDLAESLVIARRTMETELEIFSIRENPLSVLSNQIISIALTYGKIQKNHAFKIIKRAYPFSSLTKQTFNHMVEQIAKQRSIWMEDEFIGKRRNSRNYFLENISMIPDEKTYIAVDMSSRRSIGKLDESFVINFCFEGARIILRGRPWIIIKREEDKILLSESKEVGDVPSWAGEDIPIPFEVAQEVGMLRKRIAEKQKINDYPCNNETFNVLVKQIDEQLNQKFVLPDDKTFTIEVDERTIIINSCCGTKVNETLGRVISALLASSIGESVGINNDAYRIQFELPYRIAPEKIKDILLNINPDSLFYLLQSMLRNSTFIRWQLVHAARKFGALRKDFDYKNIGMKKLFTLFEYTPILEEAIDKLIWVRMDIKNTQKILTDIQNNQIKLVIQRISPIALAGNETMKGLMVPTRANRTILMALKKRLDDIRVSLICINCKKLWHSNVQNASERLKCPRCNAIKIASLPYYREDEFKILKKAKLTNEEKRQIKRLDKNASLVLTFGKNAIIALMGRGIGPDTAARILRKYSPYELKKSEDELMKFLYDIHKAEIQYAKTRGFWDN
jgi:ATP-dependent Lhr-like helicase